MEFPWQKEHATWLFERAGLLAAAGAEPVGPLVLPTSSFFPDKVDGSPEGFGRLFDRLKQHVGFSDVATNLLLVDPDANEVVSSCSSGGCGSGLKTWNGKRVETDGDGYTVHLAVPELKHPTVVTTVLARALGEIFLFEADVAAGGKERGAIADLAASMLGLAVLVANGSGIEVKGCGGIKVQSVTTLSGPLATLAVAVVQRRDMLRKPAETEPLESHLDNVARGQFAMAKAFARANDDVIRRLDDAPLTLAQGKFSLREPRTSVADRLRAVLGFKPTSDDPIVALEEELRTRAEAPRLATSGKPARKRRADADEIRALVDESFSER